VREIAVILNSFNRKALLKSAVASLVKAFETETGRLRLFVFDAGSTDGSQEWIEKFAREQREVQVRLLRPGPNDGNSFSAGINAATRAALKEAETELLFLYETDNALDSIQPIDDALGILQRHPEIGAIGFTARKYSGIASGFGCRFPTPMQFVLGPQLCHRFKLDTPRMEWKEEGGVSWSKCDVVYTSPLLIRREAWERAGEFDEKNFPFSDSDLDWAWRLKKAGFVSAVLKTDAVIHDNQNALSDWSGKRALHFHQARLRLLEKHCGCSRQLLLPLLFLRHTLEAIAACAMIGKHWKGRFQKRVQILKASVVGYGDTPA
jgi:GT2 family glycosyltransferase